MRNTRKAARHTIESEVGTIRKQWSGKTSVVLVYPNHYHVGMSNLGFQTVYRLINSFDHVVCERAFLSDPGESETIRPTTVESGRPLGDADIIAFSLSFENDYPNLLDILASAGVPLTSSDRADRRHPLVIAGGVACFLNPEPLAAFIDCFLIGEAELILPDFFEVFERRTDKNAVLNNLARQVPGAYVPALYRSVYHDDGTLAAFEPGKNAPATVKRVWLQDIGRSSTCSTIITPHTTFEQSFLVEIGRGCPHGCRFCSAGFIYRPPRFRPVSLLTETVGRGARLTDRIGLVGAAVSDHPDIDKLCAAFQNENIRFSFSSLRADRMTPELLAALKHSQTKTATIAPEVGSERMRRVINKGITEDDILNAAATLVENGMPNLKLYFMIGLPTETETDVDAIVKLVKKIKHHFLKSSRARKRIGQITVSLNSFVPKPATPFQWAAMDEIGTLKTKIRRIKNELKKVANVRINSDIPRWAYIQGLLSRGDRKVADILKVVHANHGNWAQSLKSVPVNPDFYVLRGRGVHELFPWDFIDHGIRKSFLQREYERALQARVTPSCRVETCRACGVCREDDTAVY